MLFRRWGSAMRVGGGGEGGMRVKSVCDSLSHVENCVVWGVLEMSVGDLVRGDWVGFPVVKVRRDGQVRNTIRTVEGREQEARG